MTGDDQIPDRTRHDSAATPSMRLLAEQRLHPDAVPPPPPPLAAQPPVDTAHMLHELRVHQIELEMQNEELRGAHLELDIARSRWFDLYDLAPVGYCTVSDRGMVVQANLTLSTMVDVPRSTLVRRPFSQLVSADDQDRWYLLHRQIIANLLPRSCELCLSTTGDQPLSVQLSITAAVDAQGETELRMAVTDISARREAERQLQESRTLLDAILDATPSNIFAIDRAHRFTLVNGAMERANGMTKAQLLGKTAEDLFAPSVAAAMRVVNERIMQTGEMESLEEVIRRKHEDTPRIVLAAKFALRDAHGVVTGLSGVETDVTAHRIAEAERERLAAQLQQAQKMESVGRLAGGVAHDFNNQLGVILGHAEMALARLDPSQPEHEELTEIFNAAQRSAVLTRQLLTFARRQAIHPSVLDLNQAVASALSMLRRLIGENIDLVWRPGAELWPVMMDVAQLEQILANLAVNARDAIAGHGTITVSTVNCAFDAAWCASHTDAVPGDYVQIIVSDDGSGMSDDVLANIFEPFFTTKSVGKGTGLGLPSVHGAVRQADGFITVESVVGEGTTFGIYVPRGTRAISAAAVSAADAPLARGHETILLVEDEGAIRRVLTRVLTAQGYRVLEAPGAAEALVVAKTHDGIISLLLTDIVMPGMDGPVLADMLLQTRPHIRHLFMSGYPAHSGAANVPQLDDAHFIAKPFTLSLLTAKVREVLDRA